MKECSRCGSPDTPKQRKLCTLLDCFLVHGHPVVQMTIEEEREFERSYERTPLRPGESKPFAQALNEVGRERERQIAKGYDSAHDDEHSDGSIAAAAAYYAWGKGAPEYLWPWEEAARPTLSLMPDRERLLIAAALLVAEIERIDRAVALSKGTKA